MIEDFFQIIDAQHVVIAVAILILFNSIISAPPSEMVLAAGAVAIGQIQATNILLIFFVALAANVTGASFLYWIGYNFREKILEFLGRLPFSKQLPVLDFVLQLLRHAENGHLFWICVTRFTPTIRSISSLPAGMARVNFLIYVFYTSVGCAIWISFWLAVGLFFFEVYLEFQWVGVLASLTVLMFLYILAKRVLKY